MGNLCFTERSLQFSKIAHKSLGNSIPLSPMFFFSLAPFLFSTPAACLWLQPYPPSHPSLSTPRALAQAEQARAEQARAAAARPCAAAGAVAARVERAGRGARGWGSARA
jgi:hypothetical protein